MGIQNIVIALLIITGSHNGVHRISCCGLDPDPDITPRFLAGYTPIDLDAHQENTDTAE